MTLVEIFEKHNNETLCYRQSMLDKLKKHRDDLNESEILEKMFKNSVGYLKGLKGWANQESRDMGYIIPQFMIDNAIADDWVVYNKDEN